jgi:hypothetical protein
VHMSGDVQSPRACVEPDFVRTEDERHRWLRRRLGLGKCESRCRGNESSHHEGGADA